MKGYVTNINVDVMSAGVSIKKLVQALRPLREVTVSVAGQTLTAQPHIPSDVQELIDRVTH